MSTINSTVKFCLRCQADTERNKKGECKQCAKARHAAWHKANPERAKELNAKWRKENPERNKARWSEWARANPSIRKASKDAWNKANPDKNRQYKVKAYAADPAKSIARARAWKNANPEKRKAQDAKVRANNKDKIRDRARAWHIANPDRVKANSDAWITNNPDARKIFSQNRRARKLTNGGRLSKGLSAKLFRLQKGKCACCGLPLGDSYHLDHVMPLALGGPNTDDNMQLLRKICNLQKHAKHPVQFMQERGFLL